MAELDPVTLQLLEALRESTEAARETNKKLDGFRDDLAEVMPKLKDIDWLTKVVRDGNGQPPLILRVKLLETANKEREKRKAEDLALRQTNAAGSWQVKVAMVAGGISLLISFIQAVVQWFRHPGGTP